MYSSTCLSIIFVLLHCQCTTFAHTVESQTMIGDFKMKIILNLIFDIPEQVFLYLFDIPAADADQMMMEMFRPLFTEIIPRHTVTKIDLIQNLQLVEKFKSAVNGGQPDLRIFFLHFHEYIFCAQMIIFVFQ